MEDQVRKRSPERVQKGRAATATAESSTAYSNLFWYRGLETGRARNVV